MGLLFRLCGKSEQSIRFCMESVRQKGSAGIYFVQEMEAFFRWNISF